MCTSIKSGICGLGKINSNKLVVISNKLEIIIKNGTQGLGKSGDHVPGM